MEQLGTVGLSLSIFVSSNGSLFIVTLSELLLVRKLLFDQLDQATIASRLLLRKNFQWFSMLFQGKVSC